MAKRRKRKIGLHKKVSSVFEGVSIPRADDDEQIPPKPTPESSCGGPSKPIFKDSLVSKSSLMKKVRQSKGASNKTTTDPILDSPPELPNLDQVIPQRSSVEKASQTKDSSDKTTPGHTKNVPPKRTAPDDPIPKRTPAKEPPQNKNASDKTEPERTVDIPSWMTSPDYTDARNSLMDKLALSADRPDQAESDLMGGEDPTIEDGSIPPPSLVEEPQQAEKISERTAPRGKSWVPPKLTTPDDSVSQGFSTKKSEQTESVQTNIRESRKISTAQDRASKSSLVENLLQDENEPRTSAPDRMAESLPTSKSASPQSPQNPESEKRYGPKAPPKQAAPARQSETTAIPEANGPSLWQKINNKLFAPKTSVSPTRQKVMVLFIPILTIILIFTFRQVLSKSPKKTKGTSIEDVPLVMEADPGHEIDWQIPEPLPATMRDPTQLPAQDNTTQTEEQNPMTGKKKSELIDLGTIVYSKDKSSAIVNGRIVHAGDNVSGITVLKINRDSVEFEMDGEKWVQKVRE